MKRFFLMLGLLVPMTALAACDQDGPLEEAGEDMDNAVEELQN
ncbi:hypothetical protein BN1012_Phect1802 [Candidatus Phaeomarinobacter ectocarpi]|uniref:Uncharacterized protein n=1 Tax=Candidatus Phaeomarinibacter ectocarpi TaxID=1458461 RepID=X5MND3_9HYPH|nr:hypothetical protein [Candidatus Phaeomarinobacter ectocarpi]CDO60016.1 hypothetical protein BN1012_Phect1802 [Candidatus Phaeomarinobacter ectocarpi]